MDILIIYKINKISNKRMSKNISKTVILFEFWKNAVWFLFDLLVHGELVLVITVLEMLCVY